MNFTGIYFSIQVFEKFLYNSKTIKIIKLLIIYFFISHTRLIIYLVQPFLFIVQISAILLVLVVVSNGLKHTFDNNLILLAICSNESLTISLVHVNYIQNKNNKHCRHLFVHQHNYQQWNVIIEASFHS